ncbi:MAG: hypothetical protein LUQ22_04165 [Methanotrichaceae archaeon]|nr:hypothetical protein [Methanotrichaceae archaeon]
MFKLGEYNEDEAKDIANHLKNAWMKVDLKTFTDGQLEIIHYLEGRLSELKDDVKDLDRYEQYIQALKDVLATGATAENFREKLELRLDPDVTEKRKQVNEVFADDLTEEELKSKRETIARIMTDLADLAQAEDFIDILLERNGIQIGKDVGDRLDNPIVRILADPEGHDDNHRLTKTTTTLTIEPRAEVYIDEFSSTLSADLDEVFKDEYPEEYFKIIFLEKLISNLTKLSGKMDMESFSEKCGFQIDDEGNIVVVEGRKAAEELARTLEKNNIIKVKGKSIKWKH